MYIYIYIIYEGFWDVPTGPAGPTGRSVSSRRNFMAVGKKKKETRARHVYIHIYIYNIYIYIYSLNSLSVWVPYIVSTASMLSQRTPTHLHYTKKSVVKGIAFNTQI